MSDARETLEDMLDQKHLLSTERAAIREVLADRDRLAALTCGCGDSQKEMVCVDCQMTDMRAVESKAEGRIEELEAEVERLVETLADALKAKAEAEEASSRDLLAENERLRADLVKVANAAGVETPLQLTAIAETDEETTADLLVKYVERLRAATIPSPVRPEREIERENQRLREGSDALRLKARIEAALALHNRRDSHGYCTECGDPPIGECDTVRALKGGESE